MGTIAAIFRSTTRGPSGGFFRALILFVSLWGVPTVWAAGPYTARTAVALESGSYVVFLDSTLHQGSQYHVSRALAGALTLTLGPFGAHRLYLGTAPKVPLIYGLTFGGFGVLVLIDLGHILFTRDLSRFEESRKVFMWTRADESPGTTPP